MLHFHFPKESSPAESVLSCPDLVMVEVNTFDWWLPGETIN